jgi:hypothetical protein
MDRSFLSDPSVVAASREFVCARLLTYESAEEARFLESLFRGASGQLENTVFTFLDTDGRTPLTRAGRSPDHVFRGPAEEAVKQMASSMKRMAADHLGDPSAARGVPWLVDLRRGLDVAACDLLPLVVVVAANGEARKKVEDALAPLAWSPAFIGRFEYAPAEPGDLGKIDGARRQEGIVVVEPDAFGMKGKALAQSATAGPDDLKKALDAGLKAFQPKPKDSRRHIDEGRRAGVYWKTEIPVTDPGPPGAPPK